VLWRTGGALVIAAARLHHAGYWTESFELSQGSVWGSGLCFLGLVSDGLGAAVPRSLTRGALCACRGVQDQYAELFLLAGAALAHAADRSRGKPPAGMMPEYTLMAGEYTAK
jgi:hypothetical protein